MEGRHVFESLNKSITLSRIFRQEGNDPEQIQFRDALMWLRTYDSTEENHKLFEKHFWDNLSQEERNRLKNKLHLLPTHALVHETNIKLFLNLENLLLGQSIIALQPENDGLEAEILLVEGAKVMVTRNLWTAKGVYQNMKEQVWAWLTQIHIQV